MSQARLLAPKSWDRAFYHCVSRVVDRRFIFGDEEHAEFLHIMRMYEKFCQVKVLTYCLMCNRHRKHRLEEYDNVLSRVIA